MNFFGHAAVASWVALEAGLAPGPTAGGPGAGGRRDAPAEPVAPGALALGAMLPDFASMCGARLARGPALADADAGLAAGVDLHHRTDAAFHPLPVVLALMRELDERLARRGCARGPRRAVAHVGVELLLDGVLVDDDAYARAYLAGLAHPPGASAAAAGGATDGAPGRVWADPDGAERFARLHARLAAHGVPVDLREPHHITHRLARALGHRPILAPSPADLVAIEAALVEHRPRVEATADTVLRGVRGALERPATRAAP